MQVEQFVMAYQVEQDRLRALLPEGFSSLRPVLRINTELWQGSTQEALYVGFHTPVAAEGKKGWLNIAHWHSRDTLFSVQRTQKSVRIQSPFLRLTYTGTGLQGGCPAEKDNDGTFFLQGTPRFEPAEHIRANKEFCDCTFAWTFTEADAQGESVGKTLPAFPEDILRHYDKASLTAENAAAIPCRQVLGAYIVRFER